MDLHTMQLLGISVIQPWVDHPYTNRGQYVNPYARSNQYIQRSGWSSQIAPGSLPASHLGGTVPARRRELKGKRRRRKRDKKRAELSRSRGPFKYDPKQFPPARFGAKQREALVDDTPRSRTRSRSKSKAKGSQNIERRHNKPPSDVGIRRYVQPARRVPSPPRRVPSPPRVPEKRAVARAPSPLGVRPDIYKQEHTAALEKQTQAYMAKTAEWKRTSDIRDKEFKSAPQVDSKKFFAEKDRKRKETLRALMAHEEPRERERGRGLVGFGDQGLAGFGDKGLAGFRDKGLAGFEDRGRADIRDLSPQRRKIQEVRTLTRSPERQPRKREREPAERELEREQSPGYKKARKFYAEHPGETYHWENAKDSAIAAGHKVANIAPDDKAKREKYHNKLAEMHKGHQILTLDQPPPKQVKRKPIGGVPKSRDPRLML